MERRVHRSPHRQEALGLLLESLRKRQDLEAVALSTQDGLLVAGAGEVDLERMAALAPNSNGPTMPWGARTLHVERFDQWGTWLYLATAGGSVGRATLADLRRILSEMPKQAA
ncbi:MAG: hypothetical protein HZB56_23715 [Deltaproteobacteria bacterium]|nr:hypothetical protein [Deltaproteobacteria bacterium]